MSRAEGRAIFCRLNVTEFDEEQIRHELLGEPGALDGCAALDILRQRLCSYFQARGVDFARAEDLTQDALATLIELVRRNPGRYSAEWIVPAAIATARNKLLNYWKKSSTRCEQQGALDMDVPAGDGESPERAARLGELRGAIRRLDEECREILHMKYFLGHSSREIAVYVSRTKVRPVTENAVDVRSSRCVERLRQFFADARGSSGRDR